MSDSDLTNRTWTRMTIKGVCVNIAHLFLSHTDISIVDVMICGGSLPNLTQLVLDGCSFGYAFSKNVKRFDLSGAEYITPSQYPTSTLPATPFPKLQILGLSSVHDMSIFALLWLLYRCPTLTMLRTMHTSLTLTRIMVAVARYCPALTYLEYSPVRLHPPVAFEPHQLPLMANMRTLRFHTEQDDAVLHTILDQCHGTLQQLSVTVNDANLLHLASLGPRHLETLEIPLSPGVSERGLCALIKAAPALTLLDVSYNVDAVSDTVMHLLSSLRNLKILRLFNCVNVSGDALLACVQASPSLRTLGLYQCPLDRASLLALVKELLPDGVIECPHDIVLCKRSDPDAIVDAMQLDMDMDDVQQQVEEQPPHTDAIEPATPPATDLQGKTTDRRGGGSYHSRFFFVIDILRKDDLWSVYI